MHSTPLSVDGEHFLSHLSLVEFLLQLMYSSWSVSWENTSVLHKNESFQLQEIQIETLPVVYA